MQQNLEEQLEILTLIKLPIQSKIGKPLEKALLKSNWDYIILFQQHKLNTMITLQLCVML